MAEYLKTINGSLLPIGGTNVYVEQMTQSEYDALPSATKDDNHFRVVVNPDGDEPGLQASEIVSDDGNVQDDINACKYKLLASSTANGTKTYRQILNELWTGMSDYTKVKPGAYISRELNSTTKIVYNVNMIMSTLCRFSMNLVDSANKVAVNTAEIRSDNLSTYKEAQNTSVNDVSTSTVSSGEVWKLYSL